MCIVFWSVGYTIAYWMDKNGKSGHIDLMKLDYMVNNEEIKRVLDCLCSPPTVKIGLL